MNERRCILDPRLGPGGDGMPEIEETPHVGRLELGCDGFGVLGWDSHVVEFDLVPLGEIKANPLAIQALEEPRFRELRDRIGT